MRLMLACTVLATVGAVEAGAQPLLRLGDLHREAEAADPRLRQLALLEEQWRLRERNVAVRRLPSLGLDSQVQYQTDVPMSPLTGPGGTSLFQAPKATYDSFVRLEQRLFDPTLGPQSALQRAQLAEEQARVRSTLYALRHQVNEAFFAAAALEQRAGILAATIAELEARLRETAARVEAGTAIPADAAALEASLLERRQAEDELASSRRAAVDRLASIVGRPIEPGAVPVLPDLAGAARRARDEGFGAERRPEFAQFDRTRDRLQRQREASLADTQPRVTAFARVGYGRPGLNFIRDEFDAYGVGGVRLQWNAWSWGTAARDADIARLQTEIVTAEEDAFTRSLEQATTTEVAAIERLERTLVSDRRIVELRTAVEQAARARLQEGVMTGADYAAREAELLQARFAQAVHGVELAEARARLLTTLGVEVP